VVDAAGGGAVEIAAVALNPVDLAVAAGRFYGGHPPLPYVPGCEAVGRLDGRRVYLFGDGRGIRSDGFLVERTDFPEALSVPVPDGIDDGVAAACGIAGIAGWVPVAERAPVRSDDRVLVLGASGTAGSVAVQAARLLGAERIVAAGRDQERLERARELGADATVSLEGEGLAERLREASGGDGPTLVVDLLWGDPVRAAVEAPPRARESSTSGSRQARRRPSRRPPSEGSSSRSSVTRTSACRRTSATGHIATWPSTWPPGASASTSRPTTSTGSPTPGPRRAAAPRRSSPSDGEGPSPGPRAST
jgi:hypothetical protein